MKNKYFNKLTISLFSIGFTLVILAIFFLKIYTVYSIDKYLDYINNILISFGVSFITLAITISFIQFYLDKQQSCIIEKYEKEKEKDYILNNHKIISLLIERYIIAFSNLIRKENEDFDFNSTFNLKDLSNLYEINGLISNNLFLPKIEVFYKAEELLIINISKVISGIEFKYYKNMNSILMNILKLSLIHNNYKDGILWHKTNAIVVKNLLMSDTDFVTKYRNNELKGNLSIPFIELLFFLNNQRDEINKYLKEIEEISCQN